MITRRPGRRSARPGDHLEARATKQRPQEATPYWDIERSRIERSRKGPVEVVVDGRPVTRRDIEANGRIKDSAFVVPITISSWIALRVLTSSHTSPVFVLVGGKPIRASKKSAMWCPEGIDRC